MSFFSTEVGLWITSCELRFEAIFVVSTGCQFIASKTTWTAWTAQIWSNMHQGMRSCKDAWHFSVSENTSFTLKRLANRQVNMTCSNDAEWPAKPWSDAHFLCGIVAQIWWLRIAFSLLNLHYILYTYRDLGFHPNFLDLDIFNRWVCRKQPGHPRAMLRWTMIMNQMNQCIGG